MLNFTPELRDMDWLIAKPIAHRGLHDNARGVIENTPSAFAAAISHGYPIECDLQMAGDGEVMVFHDKTLDRVCEHKGYVKSLSAAALKKVRIKGTSDCMQTLGEFLDQVAGRASLLIELKPHGERNEQLVKRVMQLVEAYRGPFALMSFDPDIVTLIRHHAPHITRGITAERTDDEDTRKLPLAKQVELRELTHFDRSQPHFMSYDALGLPYEPVTQLRKAGLTLLSWTIRSPKEAAHAVRYSDQITFEGYLP